MSLCDLYEQLQRQRREIKQMRDLVSSVFEQFAEEDMYPEHCDEIKNTVRQMRAPVRSLYRLLDAPHLPFTVVPHSFSPVITLRQVDELMDELTMLMLLFCKIYHSLQNTNAHQQEIVHKLNALIQGYEDILQHIDRLLLQVLAQKKRKV